MFKGWAILPSTEYITKGGTKTDIKQCMDFWSGEGTIVVC
jgi:hypothetical protein